MEDRERVRKVCRPRKAWLTPGQTWSRRPGVMQRWHTRHLAPHSQSPPSSSAQRASWISPGRRQGVVHCNTCVAICVCVCLCVCVWVYVCVSVCVCVCVWVWVCVCQCVGSDLYSLYWAVLFILSCTLYIELACLLEEDYSLSLWPCSMSMRDGWICFGVAKEKLQSHKPQATPRCRFSLPELSFPPPDRKSVV